MDLKINEQMKDGIKRMKDEMNEKMKDEINEKM